jgi:hypothetical protein
MNFGEHIQSMAQRSECFQKKTKQCQTLLKGQIEQRLKDDENAHCTEKITSY